MVSYGDLANRGSSSNSSQPLNYSPALNYTPVPEEEKTQPKTKPRTLNVQAPMSSSSSTNIRDIFIPPTNEPKNYSPALNYTPVPKDMPSIREPPKVNEVRNFSPVPDRDLNYTPVNPNQRSYLDMAQDISNQQSQEINFTPVPTRDINQSREPETSSIFDIGRNLAPTQIKRQTQSTYTPPQSRSSLSSLQQRGSGQADPAASFFSSGRKNLMSYSAGGPVITPPPNVDGNTYVNGERATPEVDMNILNLDLSNLNQPPVMDPDKAMRYQGTITDDPNIMEFNIGQTDNANLISVNGNEMYTGLGEKFDEIGTTSEASNIIGNENIVSQEYYDEKIAPNINQDAPQFDLLNGEELSDDDMRYILSPEYSVQQQYQTYRPISDNEKRTLAKDSYKDEIDTEQDKVVDTYLGEDAASKMRDKYNTYTSSLPAQFEAADNVIEDNTSSWYDKVDTFVGGILPGGYNKNEVKQASSTLNTPVMSYGEFALKEIATDNPRAAAELSTQRVTVSDEFVDKTIGELNIDGVDLQTSPDTKLYELSTKTREREALIDGVSDIQSKSAAGLYLSGDYYTSLVPDANGNMVNRDKIEFDASVLANKDLFYGKLDNDLTDRQKKAAIRAGLTDDDDRASMYTNVVQTEKQDSGYYKVDQFLGGALPGGLDASAYNDEGKTGDTILSLQRDTVTVNQDVKNVLGEDQLVFTDSQAYNDFTNSELYNTNELNRKRFTENQKLLEETNPQLLQTFEDKKNRYSQYDGSFRDSVYDKIQRASSGEQVSFNDNEQVFINLQNDLYNTQNQLLEVSPEFISSANDYATTNTALQSELDNYISSGFVKQTNTLDSSGVDTTNYNLVTQGEIDQKLIISKALTAGIYEGGEEDRASTQAKIIGEVASLPADFVIGFGAGKILSSGSRTFRLGDKVLDGAKLTRAGDVIDKSGNIVKGATVSFQPSKAGKFANKVLTSKPVRLASEGWTGEVHDIGAAGIDQFNEIRYDLKEGNYGQAAGHMLYGYAKEKVGDKLTGRGLRAGLPTTNANVNADFLLGGYGQNNAVSIGRIYEFEDSTKPFRLTQPNTWSMKGFSDTTGIDFGKPETRIDTRLFRSDNINPGDVNFKGQKFSNLKNVQPEDYGFDASTGKVVDGVAFKNMPEANNNWRNTIVANNPGLRSDTDFGQQFNVKDPKIDKVDRGDRIDGRNDLSFDTTRSTTFKIDKLDKVDKVDRVDRMDKVDKTGKTDKLDKLDRLDKIDKVDKIDRIDKIDRLDRMDRLDKLDRLDRIDKVDKLDKLDRLDRVDKFDKLEIYPFPPYGRTQLPLGRRPNNNGGVKSWVVTNKIADFAGDFFNKQKTTPQVDKGYAAAQGAVDRMFGANIASGRGFRNNFGNVLNNKPSKRKNKIDI
jgi:hypothetical protein